jgi:hypothetical protein
MGTYGYYPTRHERTAIRRLHSDFIYTYDTYDPAYTRALEAREWCHL